MFGAEIIHGKVYGGPDLWLFLTRKSVLVDSTGVKPIPEGVSKSTLWILQHMNPQQFPNVPLNWLHYVGIFCGMKAFRNKEEKCSDFQCIPLLRCLVWHIFLAPKGKTKELIFSIQRILIYGRGRSVGFLFFIETEIHIAWNPLVAQTSPRIQFRMHPYFISGWWGSKLTSARKTSSANPLKQLITACWISSPSPSSALIVERRRPGLRAQNMWILTALPSLTLTST